MKSKTKSPSVPQVLLAAAKKVSSHAYSPYSKVKVASAVQITGDKIYSGINIENASYGATVCAERVAIWKAISENPGAKIIEILVHTKADNPWPPCGMCRQVIAEFASPKLIVHLANDKGVKKSVPFRELFPDSFDGEFLK